MKMDEPLEKWTHQELMHADPMTPEIRGELRRPWKKNPEFRHVAASEVLKTAFGKQPR